jgi:hypothetical protein
VGDISIDPTGSIYGAMFAYSVPATSTMIGSATYFGAGGYFGIMLKLDSSGIVQWSFQVSQGRLLVPAPEAPRQPATAHPRPACVVPLAADRRQQHVHDAA